MSTSARASRNERRVVAVERALTSRAALTAIVSIGVLCRLVPYVHERALRVDEAMLALNLVGRPLDHLTGPLDFNQAAPFGFLFAERAVMGIAGASPLALRAFPLLCAVAALVLFVGLGRRLLTTTAFLVAVAWFATARGLLFYASDVKQYSGDVLVAIALTTMGIGLLGGRAGRHAWPLLVGAVLVWFSHASVFVVAGVAAAIAVDALRRRRAPEPAAALTVLVWAVSAAVMAVTLPNRLRGVRGSSETTQGGAYPGAHHSLSDSLTWLKHLGGQLASGLSLPTDFPGAVLTVLVAGVVCIGAVLLARSRPAEATILGVPLLAAIVASWLHLYPLNERTLLFSLPGLISFGATAVGALERVRRPAALAAAAAVVVLAFPVAAGVRAVVMPYDQEEIVPPITFAQEHWAPGDTLYVQYAAAYAFTYYGACGCGGVDAWPSAWRFERTQPGAGQFAPPLRPLTPQLRVGTFADADWRRYLAQIGRLRGRHVWVLTTGARDAVEADFLGTAVPRYVGCIGTDVRSFESTGGRVLSYIPRGPGALRTCSERSLRGVG